MWFSRSHCFYSWLVWQHRLVNALFGLVSYIRSDRFKIKHSECLRMLLFNSNTTLKCLSLPQCCMMMRINGVSLSLSLFFSTSLCLNRMPFLDPLNLLSRHTRDSAHNPVPPHRPGRRWQPAHRSDLLCRRSDGVTSNVACILSTQLLRPPKQTGGRGPAVSKGKTQRDLIKV